MFFQQLCGITFIGDYMESIFIKAKTGLDTGLSSFLVGLAQVVHLLHQVALQFMRFWLQALATLVAVCVVEKLGRKFLLVTCFVVMTVCNLPLAFYFNVIQDGIVCSYIEDCSKLAESMSWVPLSSLLVLIVFFSFGIGPLAWAMNAELFPREARRLAEPVGSSCGIFIFMVSFVSPNLELVVSTSGLFLIFATICCLGLLFTVFWVPETKGKTPEHMKDLFWEMNILKVTKN